MQFILSSFPVHVLMFIGVFTLSFKNLNKCVWIMLITFLTLLINTEADAFSIPA